MQFSLLGQTGLRVSQIALGSGLFGLRDNRGVASHEVAKILSAYANVGGNFIDTSDAYQGGRAESLIGEFIRGNRGDYVLASKYTRGTGQSRAIAGIGNHRKAMSQAVEASLKRLRTDYLDLYFAHLDDGVTPAAEIARGFEDLIRAGKIVYGGLSNFPAWRVATAAAIAEVRGWQSISAIQVEYSLLQRDAERELLPMGRSSGLGVMGYSPLAGGLLTGKYREGGVGRASDSNGKPPELDTRRNEVLDAVLSIATDLGVSPADVATAWVLAQSVFPILGATSHSQLQANMNVLRVTLDDDQLTRLDRVSAMPMGYPHDLLHVHRPLIFDVSASTRSMHSSIQAARANERR